MFRRFDESDAYAFTQIGSGSTAFTQNGLNQQITVGGVAATWDTKGNLTSEPQSGKTYGYSSENLLTSSSGGTSATLGYDPALRLYQVAGGTTTRFLYDGADAIAEYNGSSALQRRFVFDPTTGQPVVQYEGTGTAATNRRYLSQDERGSVISLSDSTGASLGLNTYDEYGKPGSANLGRYQYTGQKWIAEANLYDYKARDYLPHLGIFAQTDRIGTASGVNLYAYVRNDPANGGDPSGMQVTCTGSIIPQSTCGGAPELSCIGNCTNFLSDWERAQLGIRDEIGTKEQDELIALAQCIANWAVCSGANLASSGYGNGQLQYGPLTPAEQAQMSSLLSSWNFKYYSGLAFNTTKISGLEHGFFIWLTQS